MSYIDWFNHDLTTMIVRAEDWASALRQHPKLVGFDFEWTTLNAVKEQAFNRDVMVECVEITEEAKP